MLRKLSFGKSERSSSGARPDSPSKAPVAKTFLFKGLACSETEAAELALVSGALFLPERVGPQKVWRSHFMALAPREEGGLGLFTLSEMSGGMGGLWKNTQPRLKVQSLLELEEGCEVRALDADDVPGGARANCFMLVTSKTTMVFQAPSAEERARWLMDFGKEFHRHMEGNLLEQKFKLLRKGDLLVWHQPPAISVKVALSADGAALMLGGTAVPLDSIESVDAGKSNGLHAAKPEVFHFNCFIVNRKGDAKSIDLEAPKQSMRDDWVSALEAVLTASILPRLSMDASHSSTGSARSKGGKRIGVDTRLSMNDMDASPGTPTSASSSSQPLPPPPSPSQSSQPSTQSARSRVKGSTTYHHHARSSLNEQDVPGEDENASPPAPAPAASGGGVGEFFKQKVKLGAGFPYSASISHAISMSLQGDKASAMLAPPRQLSEAEFNDVVAYSKLEVPDPDKSSKKPLTYEMNEYAPGAFRELRGRYEVTDQSYLASLSRLSGDGAVGDGKSGMLFFFTEDRRYVLKTVKPNEMSVLVDKGMLGGYLRHMLDNPNSLICRFLGLYKFRMGPKGQARDIILVCMQNSFDTRLVLHEKYDLKGSTRNRWCTPRFGSVLKDLNFGNSRVAFDAEDRAAFLKQCERDTALMESYNVMDYSLLLGIHKPPEDDVAKTQRNLLLLAMAGHLEDRRVPGVGARSGRPLPTRWQRDFGGVEGRLDGMPQVYIMCIIDILQAYDTGKKLENLIKSQMSEEIGKKEISAVNPRTYRERFLQYLERITVPVEGLNAQLQASRRALKMKLNDEDQDPRSPVRRNTMTIKKTLLPTVGEEGGNKPIAPRAAATAASASRPAANSLGSGVFDDDVKPLRPSQAEGKMRSGTLVDDGDKLRRRLPRRCSRPSRASRLTMAAARRLPRFWKTARKLPCWRTAGLFKPTRTARSFARLSTAACTRPTPTAPRLKRTPTALSCSTCPMARRLCARPRTRWTRRPRCRRTPTVRLSKPFPMGERCKPTWTAPSSRR